MRGAIELHGGTVEKFIGDAVVAVFGVPAAHEDDARRALRAAVELRERLAALSTEFERERGLDLRVRVGVNGGGLRRRLDSARSDRNGRGLRGREAARGRRAAGRDPAGPRDAPPRSGLRGRRALEPIRLKDGTALGTWRLVGVVEGAPAIARRLEAPLIGRGEQLAQLRSVRASATSAVPCWSPSSASRESARRESCGSSSAPSAALRRSSSVSAPRTARASPGFHLHTWCASSAIRATCSRTGSRRSWSLGASRS